MGGGGKTRVSRARLSNPEPTRMSTSPITNTTVIARCVTNAGIPSVMNPKPKPCVSRPRTCPSSTTAASCSQGRKGRCCSRSMGFCFPTGPGDMHRVTNSSIWSRADRVTTWGYGSSDWRKWQTVWKEREDLNALRFLPELAFVRFARGSVPSASVPRLCPRFAPAVRGSRVRRRREARVRASKRHP